jgi:hypothetical protein
MGATLLACSGHWDTITYSGLLCRRGTVIVHVSNWCILHFHVQLIQEVADWTNACSAAMPVPRSHTMIRIRIIHPKNGQLCTRVAKHCTLGGIRLSEQHTAAVEAKSPDGEDVSVVRVRYHAILVEDAADMLLWPVSIGILNA